MTRCKGSDCKSEQEIDEYIDSHIFKIQEAKVEYNSLSYGDQALTYYIGFGQSFPLESLIYHREFQRNIVESKESFLGLNFFKSRI